MGAGSDAAPRRSRQHDAVSTSTVLVILGAFLASAVEMVEALTIVLGVGIVRGWRSTLIGVAAAAIVLAARAAALGRDRRRGRRDRAGGARRGARPGAAPGADQHAAPRRGRVAPRVRLAVA